MKRINVKTINEKSKKLIPILLILICVELVLVAFVIIGYRIWIPTDHMEDQEALEYILEMADDEKTEYLNRIPDSEQERLLDLWLAYMVAEAEATDTFDSIDEGVNYDTSGKTYEDYVAEDKLEANTYPLSDGSGYAIYDEKTETYTFYDNDGNEITDSSELADENGVIHMDLY